MEYKKKPAIVKYIGEPGKYQYMAHHTEKQIFVVGDLYEAYFLEYVEGTRDAVHVKCNDGEIRYLYVQLSDFEIISDEDNVLNSDEAIVRCITHEFDDELAYIKYGHEYKAIGKYEDGSFLVMDESYCCYDYSPEFFEIISDPHGVLEGEQDCYWFHAVDPDDYDIAHEFSSNHRAELEKDKVCGCFDCLRIFSPSEIKEWVPESPDGECVTAVCPFCGDDSIIGESSGYPIIPEFLFEMKKRWCL